MSTQPPIPSPARPIRPAARPPLAFLAIAGTCVIAAGVGGYVAQSHRATEIPTVEARPAQPNPAADANAPEFVPNPDPVPAALSPEPAANPVGAARETVEAEPRATARVAPRATQSAPVEKPASSKPRPEAAPARSARVVVPEPPLQSPTAVPSTRTADPAPAVEMTAPEPPAAVESTPAPAPVEPVTRQQSARVEIAETFVIPTDAVIGLEIEHTVSSETAQPEDRVDARVSRDVKIDGTTVIPAGSRVRGLVTRVENGGRFKERGRIEIRFHTLVLADGDTHAIATEALFREGDDVGRQSSARIGASAAGGAIIGAIFGGQKGAAIGAAAGAGAGTAVTASQKPSEARFRAGSVVTVRLTAPVSITVQQ